MNVWIFVLSAMFTPVVEPLGISIDSDETPMVDTQFIDISVDEPVMSPPMRYHGIERLFAQMDADAR